MSLTIVVRFVQSHPAFRLAELESVCLSHSIRIDYDREAHDRCAKDVRVHVREYTACVIMVVCHLSSLFQHCPFASSPINVRLPRPPI